MSHTISSALNTFLASSQSARWRELPFFRNGDAEQLCQELDRKVTAGHKILPPPHQVFNAFIMTPFDNIKVVILGQDPYPTHGDAHGLAFSYVGTRRFPASLRTILDEVRSDIFGEEKPQKPASGDLGAWARQGVLLLNTALTVEEANAGAHLRVGWSTLADQVIKAVSDLRPAVAFLLWGGHARARTSLIDADKHLIVESGHPSPLNRHRDFRHSRPFSTANQWLKEHGQTVIDWKN